jgi:small-conductance mechanosensitive channel
MRRPHRSPPLVDQDEAWSYAWSLALAAGWVLFVVGLVEVALAWHPVRAANPAWEFSAVRGSMSGLPLVAVGLALMGVAAILTERRRTVRIVAALGLFLGLMTLIGYIGYVADAPLALRMANAQTAPEVKESVVRVTLLSLAFSALFFGIGISVIRHLQRNPI